MVQDQQSGINSTLFFVWHCIEIKISGMWFACHKTHYVVSKFICCKNDCKLYVPCIHASVLNTQKCIEVWVFPSLMPLYAFSACKSFERALPHISSRLNALFGWAFNHIPGYVVVCWQWPVPISKALSGPMKQDINSSSNHLITLGKVAQPHSLGKNIHMHIWTILLRNYCLS